MSAISLVPDEDLLSSGIVRYVDWDYTKYPQMVIFGQTGSGKTYLLKLILGRIGKDIPESEILLCDYKGDDDFSFAEGAGNFFRYQDCMDGLAKALQTLKDRQQKVSPERHFVVLVFDEWASFISNLEKKEAEKCKQDLSYLLMLGRSFHVHVILSQQRLDSSYFSAGARDNFSVVFGMGHLSKESVEMMFSEYKDQINREKSQGHGSCVLGNSLHNISVPQIGNMAALHAAIIAGVNRFDGRCCAKGSDAQR